MATPRKMICILALFLFSSCGGPSSLEELRSEAEGEFHRLAVELKGIQNKEELQRAVSRLKKRFNKVADLVIATRAFSQTETEQEMTPAAEELFLELARLYELPGGRELVESAQREAVNRINFSR